MNWKTVVSVIILAGLATFIPITKSVSHVLKWGTIPTELYTLGVIDENKFPDVKELVGPIDLKTNPRAVLNTLWAFGLANKNAILEMGPMSANTASYASTGGWTLAAGTAMDHYSMHELVKLNPDQQKIVERVSKNVYRPCCKNPAYFPDCNHGMAMLALLQLAAGEDWSEQEMYALAKEANAVWFPPRPIDGCGTQT